MSNIIRLCTIDECKRKHQAKGYCLYHYTYYKRKNENRICAIPDCNQKQFSSDYCSRHYNRLLNNRPLEKKSFHELNPKERLDKFVTIDLKSQCWIWTGSKNKKNYGCIHFKGKTRIAHRLAYELYKGQIPKGLLVCHNCDNPSCINPDHLFLGTNQDNSNDKFSKNREKILYGQSNGNSKLTTNEVVNIKRMLISGYTPTEISRKFNVSDGAIFSIRDNNTWRHVLG